MKKRFAALFLAFVLLLVCFAGCSSQSLMLDGSAGDAAADDLYVYNTSAQNTSAESAPSEDTELIEAEEDHVSEGAISAIGDTSPDRKIIRNADITLETKEFDDSVAKLQSIVDELGGYISQANVYVHNSRYELHSADYTVRIPAEKFDQFLVYREDVGTVSSTNVWTDDVTDSYYDMEARLESLETKRTRLLELLEQAETMENIIALESELSNTIYEIESLTGSLRRLDDQISYSTIYVYISEVREVTEPVTMPRTLGENFVVWIVGASPVLVILAVLAVIVILIIKRGSARRAARREEKALKNAEAIARWHETHTETPAITRTVEKRDAQADDKKEE